jgi:hypothetical protein
LAFDHLLTILFVDDNIFLFVFTGDDFINWLGGAKGETFSLIFYLFREIKGNLSWWCKYGNQLLILVPLSMQKWLARAFFRLNQHIEYAVLFTFCLKKTVITN